MHSPTLLWSAGDTTERQVALAFFCIGLTQNYREYAHSTQLQYRDSVIELSCWCECVVKNVALKPASWLTFENYGLPAGAQARIALVNTALTAAGMWALAIPGLGLLSLFVFICSFIPIAGCFISTVPIAFVALTEYGFLKARSRGSPQCRVWEPLSLLPPQLGGRCCSHDQHHHSQ